LQVLRSDYQVGLPVCQSTPTIVWESVELSKDGRETRSSFLYEAEHPQLAVEHVATVLPPALWVGVGCLVIGLKFQVLRDDDIEWVSYAGEGTIPLRIGSGDLEKLVIAGMLAQYSYPIVLLAEFPADGG
jgi:hypothetical protein